MSYHYSQRTAVQPSHPESPCDDHMEGPEGYNQWFAWAARMGRTHYQLRCGGCGLYKIWIPK
ncbi:hypothetical protein QE394_001124 [Arthrobacter sp. SORGH_AS 212]|uniref:hypothetical protein n=1 Tax=Pseudarthrobacter sp. SORGH_AS 212 TaxID=3041777 RepID=UPI002781C744|nr:hypothetical protein [Arthrobacter sp. SORGH_AS_0212]